METKKLGFGLMRLPQNGNREFGGVDIETLKDMVDYFLENGFTYFDTSYVYHNGYSERAIKAALVDRHPRESYTLADKLPTWMVTKESDVEKYLNEQLQRTGAGYYDYYLMHAITGDNYRNMVKVKAFDTFKRLRESGKIRHICISFHDTAEILDEILMEHPEIEFVQIIVNYADFNNDGLEMKACYDTVVSHNRQVIVMEPVKGGQLANVGEKALGLFKENSEATPASYAIRFAASQPNVYVVLSGMSNMEQMLDNTSFMKEFVSLSDSEYEILDKVNEIFDERKEILVDSDNKAIHTYFALYNNRKMFPSMDGWQNILYNSVSLREGRASELIKGEEDADIIEGLRKVIREFE